jgi:hypothetical protein
VPPGGRRAENLLVRLLAKVRNRRERLEHLYRRLETAREDDKAAWAELDHERVLNDPDDRRFGSLPAAFAIAVGVTVVDVFPAMWASEALGNGVTDTWLVTAILVAGLTAVAWMMSHYKNKKGARGQFLAALGLTCALILVEGGLRMRYLLVVNSSTMFDAALQGFVLALISGVLIWIGYMKLVDAEPYSTWKRRRAVNRSSADVKKFRVELDRLDAEYRQARQALEQASLSYGSSNPRLQTAIDMELSYNPYPTAPPEYQSEKDRFLGEMFWRNSDSDQEHSNGSGPKDANGNSDSTQANGNSDPKQSPRKPWPSR